MTVSRIIDNDFSFNASLIIQGYNSGIEYVNTPRDGWNDIPWDLYGKTLVSMSVEDGAILLLIED